MDGRFAHCCYHSFLQVLRLMLAPYQFMLRLSLIEKSFM
uniref:Uncharacterized protein n=1 Tax=Anguilla anguilla TaxID=7936 RepID=A0A0E9PXT6_ANGAN